MYNSQNLPYDVTYTKSASKAVKQLSDYLSLSELHVLNARIAERDNQAAIRKIKQAAIDSLDGNWGEMLSA